MEDNTKSKKQAVIVGTGIAGISLAEILARNGYQITLVEKNEYLGGDASLNTQNWFHTGWLYAALPYHHALRGCYEGARLYYRLYTNSFGKELVNLDLQNGNIKYRDSKIGWFVGNQVHFIFSISGYDLNLFQKFIWKYYLSAIPFRRLRNLRYPVNILKEIPDSLNNLLNHWEKSNDGKSRYQIVKSTDANIQTKNIMNSLLKRLGSDLEVFTGVDPELINVNDTTKIKLNGKIRTPDILILSSGKGLKNQLLKIDKEKVSKQIKSVCSPILVMKKHLGYPNFIRFTPNLPETLNHLAYSDNSDCNISTVGSYDFFDPETKPDLQAFRKKICDRLKIDQSEVLGSYFGTKTEYTSGLERRYNHVVNRVNHNTYFALAGKFSQFPLLVADFAEQIGLQIDLVNPHKIDDSIEVRQTEPQLIFKNKGSHLNLVSLKKNTK